MIYIVRHGQTDFNVEGRYGGRIDTPLNEKGIEQAKELKEKFKNIEFDVVITSPLTRTKQTAREITNKEFIVDERIIERSNGDMEGKLKTEIKEKVDFNDPNETRYNIENIIDFKKRIYDFLDDVKEKYKGKNVLIVTHAGISMYARVYFEGEPASGNYLDYKLNNCDYLAYEN